LIRIKAFNAAIEAASLPCMTTSTITSHVNEQQKSILKKENFKKKLSKVFKNLIKKSTHIKN